MRLSFGQEMRQVQKQILAPRMIQSMEILQLPILALQERIEQELQENPLLELREDAPESDDAGGASTLDEPAENPEVPTEGEREFVVDESSNNSADFERLLEMDQDIPDHFDERTRLSSQRMEEEADRKHDAMANMPSRPQSLHEYLRDQIGWFDLDPPLRTMVERVIYALDSNGYLPTRLEDLVDPHGGPGQVELAERALAVVQKLDPPGVGARNFKECLLLQLTPDLEHYDELKVLINNHLEDIAHNRLPLIERKTGFSLETIQAALKELAKLKPKPGADYEQESAPNVTPDVFVEQDENGRYMVRLEDERTPRLFISQHYRQLLQQGTSAETKEYIRRKINSAQWLIESIEQRRSTLTKVSQAIVDYQHEFLSRGPEFIEPLKMQQIADKVGVHVTTVSRAVDDKWIQTPRGIFPLRRFFGGGTKSAAGEDVAWDAIRLKLQEIIDHENKANPLSDEALVHELEKHGLLVKRRTVTKYREAMRIPSSRQRRDWTAASHAAHADAALADAAHAEATLAGKGTPPLDEDDHEHDPPAGDLDHPLHAEHANGEQLPNRPEIA